MSAQNETEVESLLMSPCWSQAHAGPNDQYLLDGHKLLLDHDLDSLPSSDNEGQKTTIEVLDNLLLSSHQSLQTNLAELKPLPPFTGYTGHLSINGISGHHYHAIAQRLPDDNNNNSISNNLNHGSCLNHSPFSQSTSNGPSFNQNSSNNNVQQPLTPNSNCSSTSSPTDHNIVSSSTCLPDSGHSDEPCLHDVKLFSPDSDSKLYNVADSCVMANGNNSSSQGNGASHNNSINGSGLRNMSSADHRMADSVSGLKIYTNESKELNEYDMSSIEDIAAIIGSAIADTTVPNRMDGDTDTNHNNESRDSWMDLDAWIDGACVQTDGKLIITQQDSLGDYVMPQSPHSINSGCPNSGPILPSPGSTLQNLLTHGYMPLLQNRLQNGPPNSKGETPSSTSYGSDLISTSTSPPGSVVSTTDNIIMGNGLNGSRYMQNNVNNQHHYHLSMNIKADGMCSPDLMGNNNNNSSTNNNNYPHTTTILGNSPSAQQSSKIKRSRVPKHKLSGSSQSPGGGQGGGGGGGGGGGMGNGSSHLSSSGPMSPTTASMGLGFQGGNDLSGLLGKEKPVHRCNICNRGFLNKSNIKVHLRTHTGEKPFRCDVCSKAFRQKAHLIKHQQIHKRIGRD